MKFTIKVICMVLLVFISAQSFAKGKIVKATGGIAIPVVGIAIDASYDPRLDTLIPGYKIINVILVNSSFNITYLDPEKDKWWISLAGEKSPIKAISNLRREDPKAWSNLAPKVRELIAYPLVLPIGGREVLDIFVPASADVSKLNVVSVFFKSLNATIDVSVSGN